MQPTERTPMVRPAKLQMAPHARAGYRTAFGLALFILTLFFGMAVAVSLLNWDVPCDKDLALELLIYGALGLTFVISVLHHYIYYKELGAWPGKRTATVCLILLLALFAVGCWMIHDTLRTRDTCRLSAPFLWRWCFAILLFFVIIVLLALMVPFLRCFCGCCVAPVAYACVGCSEAVKVSTKELELPELERLYVPTVSVHTPLGDANVAVGSVFGAQQQEHHHKRPKSDYIPRICGGGGYGPLSKSSRDPDCCPGVPVRFRELFAGTIELFGGILLAPIAIPIALFFAVVKYCLKPCYLGLRECNTLLLGFCGAQRCSPAWCCSQCSVIAATCFPFCSSWLSCFQCVVDFSVGQGCLAPGKSLLALFVNTAALLWLFVFFLIEVTWNWGLTCDPVSSSIGPSALHWMILCFAITGIVCVVGYFLYEVFTSPPSPPRSAVEADGARVRRRGRVLGYSCLFFAFILFGAALLFFVLTEVTPPPPSPMLTLAPCSPRPPCLP